MENLGLLSSHRIVLGVSPIPRNPTITSKPFVGLPNLIRNTGNNGRQRNPASSFTVISLFGIGGSKPTKIIVPEKAVKNSFSRSSSTNQETSSIGVNPQLSVPPPSHVGSPLFWIGVGVGLSALFSWVAGRAKKHAMEVAFKTITQQMNAQNNPFGNAASSPGFQPFPFPPPSTSPPLDYSGTLELPATVEAEPPSVSVEEIIEPANDGPKKYAFVDVSPEETLQKNAFENYTESTRTDSSTECQSSQPKVPLNSTAPKQGTGPSTSNKAPLMSVEVLEKMMEDPTVQKIILPYLPEEMRNPTTFKWMLQNPQYRQQLQDMLNNMGGSPGLDNRLMDSLKNFDLSNPEIKQQFDEIGLTPEEVLSKIMSNREIAVAFSNPRIQSAILDCSQNPLSIAKYKNDKEVMDVFNKISQMFPGVTGF